MTRTLRLPNGETVTEDDLILYNGYPYRVRFVDDEEYEFELAPLYWGDSGMDIPFADREALEDQWESDSRGTLSDSEWERWVADARRDSQFSDEEVNEIARELSISTGLLDRLRQLFSR
ncbi:hypothetical protein A4G99_21900 [Haladaptatus sp. R4]|uniref:hypothetical protein n=1 Tax=Haladaptatus sp. R4 TaxID=1679489 RepID=UPI0007B4B60A|nr:hypothetical protein [Haladaptatus sp. R4]KZN26267.1 hypothetical protein A4G99_21900 [Haladaptatus sp. R4]